MDMLPDPRGPDPRFPPGQAGRRANTFDTANPLDRYPEELADAKLAQRKHAGYVELHAHSAYSFLDGASLPEELAARAAELGYDALALTDHDGVYGSLEFAYAAKHFGVRPITGAEVTLEGGTHLTLLVESRRGYENLCRILTEAHAGTRPAAK